MRAASADFWRLTAGAGAIAVTTLACVNWLHVSNAATVSTIYLLIVLGDAATSRLWADRVQ